MENFGDESIVQYGCEYLSESDINSTSKARSEDIKTEFSFSLIPIKCIIKP